MLDMNNLRKEKHEGICKIFDLVLVVLLAVFFILSLCPYYSVSKGDMIVSRGFETKADSDDSWSLLSYCGLPYNHESVATWQEDMYKENKSTIKENENNGYDGFFSTLAGKIGITLTNDDGEKNPYQALAVPGITTKTVSIKQVGGILFLDIFAIIGIVILLLKKGLARAVYSVIWGIIGVLAFMFNYLMNMSTTAVRPVMLAVTVAILVLALIDTVFYAIDSRSRAAYLKSVSAAYA
jgi:hypothetical protein